MVSKPDTDLLKAQSDPYRRMSANLYATARPGEYYHIHGSLEASTTLSMLDLEPFRPDLNALGHEAIVEEIESHVKRFTSDELEKLNAEKRQAGVPALRHDEFLKTPHVRDTDHPCFSAPTDSLSLEIPLTERNRAGQT